MTTVTTQHRGVKGTITAFAIVFVTIITLANCCTTIDSGSVGIRFKKWSNDPELRGGVIGTCKGWVWYNPITQNIYQYPTYIQRKTYTAFDVQTKDASIFNMSPTIAYHIDPERATDIFIKYRESLDRIEDGYIHTCIFEAYRTCGNEYTADQLMSNREEFELKVRQRLNKTLLEEGFIVSEFTTQIMPPQSLRDAIDAKNQAVQNALKAENKVKEAEAEAKIAIAKAEGEAKALRIQGDGEAYYNRVVAASINELLVRQYAIEKWDGKLPEYTGGSIPFINASVQSK